MSQKQYSKEDEEMLKRMWQQKLKQEQEQQALHNLLHQRQQEAIELMKEPLMRTTLSVIAATDMCGGFAKDGQIPWHYSEDFKWFKNRTMGNVCIMGKNTYEDINQRLGEKARENVLPGRQSFVISKTLKDISNATVIRSLDEVDKILDFDDPRTRFVIGGGQLFREAISMATTIYLTTINKNFNCDRFFPTQYLQQQFEIHQTFKKTEQDDLRFTIWKRKTSDNTTITTLPIIDIDPIN